MPLPGRLSVRSRSAAKPVMTRARGKEYCNWILVNEFWGLLTVRFITADPPHPRLHSTDSRLHSRTSSVITAVALPFCNLSKTRARAVGAEFALPYILIILYSSVPVNCTGMLSSSAELYLCCTRLRSKRRAKSWVDLAMLVFVAIASHAHVVLAASETGETICAAGFGSPQSDFPEPALLHCDCFELPPPAGVVSTFNASAY